MRDPRQTPAQLPPGWRWPLALAILVYLAVLLSTRPDTYIDSFNYAEHIVDQYQGGIPPGNDPFYDFGHVLWRPMGYLVYAVFGGIFTAFFHGNQIFAAALSLIVWNVAAGLIATAVLYLLLCALCRRPWVASLTTMGFAGTHAVMNFSLSGNAYMAGAACQIGALYCLYAAIRGSRRTAAKAVAGGALLGLSIGIWFPFVLPVPGLLCFALLWREEESRFDLSGRIRLILVACVVIAVVLAAVYIPVMALRHISSFAGARQWMESSRYGISPTNGFARMLFSIPRSFFLLGGDNLVWKRLLLSGPGGPAGILAAAGAAWKPALVYGVFGFLVFQLRTSGYGRRMLVCLLVTAAPLVVFAAFLFDPSPPERYMGIFPLLFASMALTLAKSRSTAYRAALAGFFACMLAVNGYAMSRFRSDAPYQATIDRLESVNRYAAARDRIFVPTVHDEAAIFVDARPFHPASRFRLGLTIGIPLGQARVGDWRKTFADLVLQTWERGGQVWVSRRFLAEIPSPQWWVEGDDRRVKWRDVPEFFRTLDLVNPVGGEDGFYELARTAGNDALLRKLN